MTQRTLDPIAIPESALQGLRAARPLTVLRAPRGYGKTSVIQAWLAERSDVHVVQVSLTAESHTVPGFWRELDSALQNGLPARSTEWVPHGGVDATIDARSRVLGTIAELQSSMLVVIDDYHEAGLSDGAARIDDDLVELARRNQHFQLLVASRSHRIIEAACLLSADGMVLEPADLRLDGAATTRLADQTGLPLSGAEADQLVEATGGWPALVRVGLARMVRGQAALDSGLVDSYIAQALADMEVPGLLEFALRMSVPDTFTTELAVRLHAATSTSPALEVPALLRHLEAAGLAYDHSDNPDRVYAMPPAVRGALLRLGQEQDPTIVQEAHRVLIHSAAEANDPVQALMHAVESSEVEVAFDILKREWGWQFAAAPEHSSIDAPRTLRRASTFGREVAERLRTWLMDDDDSMSGMVHLAATNLMFGNLSGAIQAFTQIRSHDFGSAMATRTLEIADIGMALCHSFEGDPKAALRVIQESHVSTRLSAPPDPDDLAVVGALVARTIALADLAHPDAEACGQSIPLGAERDEFWAVTVLARAHALVCSDDTEARSRLIYEVRTAMRHVPQGTQIESMLGNKLVELLLAEDMVDIAHEVAHRLTRGADAYAAQAKSALASRKYDEALRCAEQILASADRTHRNEVESRVMLAVAQHGLDDTSAAASTCTRAIQSAKASGQRRPFIFMPSFVFDHLASDEPTADGFLTVDNGQTASSDTSHGRLTAKEIEILRALERHPGPTGIAQEMGLSANTVKTHLRAIYRKLRVTNRAEALAAMTGVRGR